MVDNSSTTHKLGQEPQQPAAQVLHHDALTWVRRSFSVRCRLATSAALADTSDSCWSQQQHGNYTLVLCNLLLFVMTMQAPCSKLPPPASTFDLTSALKASTAATEDSSLAANVANFASSSLASDWLPLEDWGTGVGLLSRDLAVRGVAAPTWGSRRTETNTGKVHEI